MPAQPGATLPGKSPTAAPSGASRWLGPLAGLAAGLGLGALLSHFGLSSGFGSLLLMVLLVVGVIIIVRMLLARSAPPRRPLAYTQTSNEGRPTADDRELAPTWGGAPRFEPVLNTPMPSLEARTFPPGFDVAAFLKQAKLQFVRLQSAHDTGDRATLMDVLTPEMAAEVMRDLDANPMRSPSEVVTLNAEVLEVATEGDAYWASVRFTGLMREGSAGEPSSFDEVWNLRKPTDGSSGWLLAGIQQTA
jgi:predicted lipid-binding transport protein (Tim44 family)